MSVYLSTYNSSRKCNHWKYLDKEIVTGVCASVCHQQEGIQATLEYSLTKDSHKKRVPSNRLLGFGVLKGFFDEKNKAFSSKIGQTPSS